MRLLHVGTAAPELLYGARHYDTAVDMWAVGCIFAELINMSPLFPGENDIDQLYRVHRALGTPDEKSWPGCTKLPDFNKISFPPMEPIPFEKLVPEASPVAISLLKRLLVYSPKDRITAREALAHDYFFTFPPPLHYSQLAPLARLSLRKPRATEFELPPATAAAAPSAPSKSKAEDAKASAPAEASTPAITLPSSSPSTAYSAAAALSLSLFPFRRYTARIRLRKAPRRKGTPAEEGKEANPEGAGGNTAAARQHQHWTFDVEGPFRIEDALPR